MWSWWVHMQMQMQMQMQCGFFFFFFKCINIINPKLKPSMKESQYLTLLNLETSCPSTAPHFLPEPFYIPLSF